MEFANILLLAGGLAFAIPLIIHLLNRSKFEVVPWGAMHLLESIELQNMRRWQWQSWLLLLVRCLIPLLLAVCMARPLLTAWRMNQGGENTAMVIVVDDSYSMQATLEAASAPLGLAPSAASGGNTSSAARLSDVAEQELRKILRALGNRNQYSLIAAGPQATNLTQGSTFDHRAIEQQLDELSADRSGLSAAAALTLAQQTLASSDLSDRQVLVISDFQAADWQTLPAPFLRAFGRDTDGGRDTGRAAQLTFLPLRGQTASNLEVQIDAVYSETLGRGEGLEVRGIIKNWGKSDVTNQGVDLEVDGQVIATRRVDIASGSQSQVRFGCSFDVAGPHQVAIQVQDASSLVADNRAILPVTVIDQLKVLLVEGATDPAEAGSERSPSFFLELALQASANPAEGEAPWVQIKRCQEAECSEQQVAWADVIVLANVRQLSDTIATSVHRRVITGAGLLVFPGPASDPAWFAQWQIDSADGSPVSQSGVDLETTPGFAQATRVLPMRWNRWIAAESGSDVVGTAVSSSPLPGRNRLAASTSGDANDRGPDAALHVSPGPYQDIALSFFDQPEQGDLSQIYVRHYAPLVPGDDAPSAEITADTLLNPALDGDPENATAGRPNEPQPPPVSATRILARLSNGSPFLVAQDLGKGRVVLCATSCEEKASDMPLRPVFVPLVQRLVMQISGQATPVSLARRADGTSESDLQVLGATELQALADSVDGQIVRSAEEFLQNDSLRQHGWEIWRYVLLALIVFLFAELLLQRPLAEGSR